MFLQSSWPIRMHRGLNRAAFTPAVSHRMCTRDEYHDSRCKPEPFNWGFGLASRRSGSGLRVPQKEVWRELGTRV